MCIRDRSLVVQNRALASVEDQQLTRDLAHLGRITKDLQRTAMSLRMVPIRATFQKMHRLVRDTAAGARQRPANFGFRLFFVA